MDAALADTAYRKSDTGAREPVPGALPRLSEVMYLTLESLHTGTIPHTLLPGCALHDAVRTTMRLRYIQASFLEHGRVY